MNGGIGTVAVVDVHEKPIGAATLVASDLGMTCSHVLRAGGYTRMPGVTVHLLIGGSKRSAVVLEAPWLPDDPSWPSDVNLPPTADVVVFRLTEPIPECRPLLRSLDWNDATAEMISFGFTADRPAGVEARFRVGSLEDHRGLRQLTWQPGAFAVDRGFSGGPVVDAERTTVGVVVLRWAPDEGDRHSPPTGYMLPVTAVSELVRSHGIEFPEITPSVLIRYHGAARVVEIAKRRRAEDPLRRQEHDRRIFPVDALVGQADQQPGALFAQIEVIHAAADPVSAVFRRLSAAKLVSDGPHHVYLQAPGGAGKSFFQFDLLITAASAGIVPFFLSTATAGGRMAEVFKSEDSRQRLNRLFEVCDAENGFNNFERAVQSGDVAMLVVDGVNETTESVEALMAVMRWVSTNYDRVRVVIADRMTPRRAYPTGYCLATLAPLPLDIIEAAVTQTGSRIDDIPQSFRRILRIPFFLDLYRTDPKALKRTDLILRYVERMLYGDPAADWSPEYASARAAIKHLSILAFDSYQDLRAPGISFSALRQVASDQPELSPERLQGSGLMRELDSADRTAVADGGEANKRLVFWHQLIQDSLAAWHFLGCGMSPDPEHLDTLTLDRQSSDALVVALETAPESSDELLTGIYNWDHAIALSCVLETRSDPEDGLAAAVCAVIAEKIGDPFLHTRLRVQMRIGALQRFLPTDGEVSPEAVLAYVRQTPQRFRGPRLKNWWRAFIAKDPNAEELWDALTGQDPLGGWAAATALRRLEPGGSVRQLRQLYRASRYQMVPHQPGPGRWRIVHIMGRVPDAAEFLHTVVWDEDEHQDVRYGAARSLVEISAGSDETLGCEILARITEKLRTTARSVEVDSKLLRAIKEFRSCAILDTERSREPDWWHGAYEPILEAGIAVAAAHPAEHRKWTQQLELFHSARRELSE